MEGSRNSMDETAVDRLCDKYAEDIADEIANRYCPALHEDAHEKAWNAVYAVLSDGLRTALSEVSLPHEEADHAA